MELDPTARACPLCHTPVANPSQPVREDLPTPFPTERQEVPPLSPRESILLCSSVLGIVSVCCGLLNLLFLRNALWSPYVIGACAMLWIWIVLPQVAFGLPVWGAILADAGAVAAYLAVIAALNSGWDWYVALALPIMAILGVLACLYWLAVRHGRSILSRVNLALGEVGAFVLLLEWLLDRYLTGTYQPGWSGVTATILAVLILLLLIVRYDPELRERVRRRFHF